jgi:Flp pilus assembly protein TadG
MKNQLKEMMVAQALRALAAIGEFQRNRQGNVAVIFALAMMPVVAAAGVSVDLSRAYLVKSHLTQALDAAGLAVAGTPGLTNDALATIAQDYFDANYSEADMGVPGELHLDVGDNVVTLAASATLPTALLGVFGIHDMAVNSEIEVTRETKGLEVVLVLDNTGSMGSNGKINALKDASESLIGILFGDDPNPEKLKMGLVPFAAGVNVGTDFPETALDMLGRSSIHDENFTSGTNLWDLYDDMRNRSWTGCVQTRPGNLDVLDTPPRAGQPDTLWVPWFAPDEPDGYYGYTNNYLNDDTRRRAREEERQRNTSKYDRARVYSSSRGPDYGCGMRPITPLTNDRDLLLDEVDAMNASGLTHIPVGLAWGWRVISPGEPFRQGGEYNDPEVNKAIILLTDGENVLGTRNNHNRSYYTAYGYLSEGRLGTTSKSGAQAELNPRTLDVCDNIKDEGVRLYTITFQVSSSSTQNMMEECATSPALYFDSPSNQELERVFQAIARDLSNLRLSR